MHCMHKPAWPADLLYWTTRYPSWSLPWLPTGISSPFPDPDAVKRVREYHFSAQPSLALFFFFLNELKNNSLKRKGGKIWISPFLIGRALSTNHVARFLNALDLGSCDMRLRLQFLFSEQNHPLSFLAQALCLDKFSSTCQRSPLP